MSVRVLACGSRDYPPSEREQVYAALSAIQQTYGVKVLIHGAARGADRIAADWADEQNIPTWSYPADWDRHGRAAGPIRNRRMLTEAQPDVVVAFPSGPLSVSVGTLDMVTIAEAAGVRAVIVGNDDRPRRIGEQQELF